MRKHNARGTQKKAAASRDFDLRWSGVERTPLHKDGEAEIWKVLLKTDQGDAETLYHPVARAKTGVVWVGGSGGGLDGPARGLYPAACSGLQALGVSGLRLHYRRPNHLSDCVLDTLLGVEFLRGESIDRVALVGHSFGGAVVITAGANSEMASAVVPMSSQTYGTDLVPALAPRPLLLIHGTEDEILPDDCSRDIFARAREPKELRLFAGARHGLDEAREEILALLIERLSARLQ